jgi:hypothetical protein
VCTVNITGDVNGGYGSSSRMIIINAGASLYITGNVYGGAFDGNAIYTVQAVYLNIVGVIGAQHTSGFEATGVVSTSGSAVNLFTGPFVSGPYGACPFQCSRMNYQKTIGSYFEFRDSSTNGALPPATAAPAARLVSPDTVVDAPVPANVRDGVTYALATLTGTLKVPSPDSVAKGVPTDNTVGNAVLTPDAVWNYATANLTDANSIGARLKNVSTVETTGEQLEALL